MFEKFCRLLCLHTKKTRILFFVSLTAIMAVTAMAALYWYKP